MVRRTVAPLAPRKPTNAAEAICEAALRPMMRFVAARSEMRQGAAMVFNQTVCSRIASRPATIQVAA